MNKVIIVGGGAAGMMAAISASKEGKKACILEKNEKLVKENKYQKGRVQRNPQRPPPDEPQSDESLR